jgi:hypothetical protein
MSYRIIKNNTPFTTQTMRLFIKAITGGKGGILNGMDLDQQDWINSQTDLLKISPGAFVFNGQIVKIINTININGIFASTNTGDFLYIVPHLEDNSTIGVQFGFGGLQDISDIVIIGQRKGSRWYRKPNILLNNKIVPKDTIQVISNPDSNITEIKYT